MRKLFNTPSNIFGGGGGGGEEKEMLITVCICVNTCIICIYMYTDTYFQQPNSAEGITKYNLTLKAKNILSLVELLKRHLFEELGIQDS